MNTETLPPDPAIPRIQTALDGGLMRGYFEDGLRRPGNNHIRVSRCRVLKFRYRRPKLLTVHYELELCDTSTGRVWRQWMIGVMYAGKRAQRRFRRLEPTDRRLNLNPAVNSGP